MFGGLAFLVNGNMSVVVSGHGGLMVRVSAGDTRLVSASCDRSASPAPRVPQLSPDETSCNAV